MRFVICSILMTSSVVFAQEADPLFQSDEILQVTIEGPLSTLVKEKSKEDYLNGYFRYTEADGTPIEFDIKLRARGNFRHDNCDYPPVRLNFKKSQIKNTLFHKQDKLKLVVHCSIKAKYHQIVLQEYLAYRVLNALTDLSFRVRLLQITYVDTDEPRRTDPRYAFLIEHKDRLSERIDIKQLETVDTRVVLINPEQLNLTSVFQYFIGNTDFSPIAGPPGSNCCHNYVLFKNPDYAISAIPYDFDQSGFVDAPYAIPNPAFRIRTVRQRVYRGRCVNNANVENSIQQFRDKREAIYALIDGQEGFDDSTRKDLTGFVDKFYKVIESPKNIERTLLKKCV
jgi:hypothetical protein